MPRRCCGWMRSGVRRMMLRVCVRCWLNRYWGGLSGSMDRLVMLLRGNLRGVLRMCCTMLRSGVWRMMGWRTSLVVLCAMDRLGGWVMSYMMTGSR